jgi:hypothetical protein
LIRSDKNSHPCKSNLQSQLRTRWFAPMGALEYMSGEDFSNTYSSAELRATKRSSHQANVVSSCRTSCLPRRLAGSLSISRARPIQRIEFVGTRFRRNYYSGQNRTSSSLELATKLKHTIYLIRCHSRWSRASQQPLVPFTSR